MLLHQLADPRMIHRDPSNILLANQIRAAVADMAYTDHTVVKLASHHRRAHSGLSGNTAPVFDDPVVGNCNGTGQQFARGRYRLRITERLGLERFQIML